MKNPILLLLFEDNPSDARLFREYLREDAFSQMELDHVERLKTGLEYLTRGKPHVILLDLGLPDSQGLETFTQVYAQAQDVPIVVLTGLNDTEQAVAAVRAGAQDYLVKGEVSGGLLARAVRYAIERKQVEKALQEREKQEQRLLEQQIATNKLALALGETLSLKEVYHTICQNLRGLMDVWCFIISSYDDQAKLIRAEYVESDQVYDVSGFPPIPLGDPGKGTQSQVIHTGQPLYTPDHQKAVENSKVRYTIEDDGSVHEELPSEKEQEETTRSVIYLPMKVQGKTVGIMQVQSSRLDAYSEEDINLLAGMANVSAVAIQSARLHEDVLHELAERKVAEEALRQSNAFNTMLLQTIPFGMDIVNEAGQILFLDAALEKLLSKDALGKFCWDLYKDNQQQCRDCPLKDKIKPGETNTIETTGVLGGRIFEISHTGMNFHGQNAVLEVFHDITERKQAEEEVRQRLSELEVVYASSQAIGQLLLPKEIGQKIMEILSERLDWHHATIRQYHPESETIELLAFHQPGLEHEVDRLAAEKRFTTIIRQPGQGLAGWVIQHGQPVYCDDVTKDPRYVEVWPEIRSGMYVPLKIGERAIGCLSVESEQTNAFTEIDEWLISTLATQAASALENARLFEMTRQRLIESEAINKISIALRTAESLDNMLPAFLDETLGLLGTPAGAFWLYDPDHAELHHAVSRGWFNQLPTMAIKPGEGLAGTAFAAGKPLFSREFTSKTSALDNGLSQIPAGWEGISMPIRSAQAIVGVMLIFVPLPRELTTGEIQILNTLAEIVGIAIQRMRLHEKTEQQLQQLQALHEIDTVIASSFDLSFTLDIFLKNVLTELQVDAASILLLNPTRNYLTSQRERVFACQASNRFISVSVRVTQVASRSRGASYIPRIFQPITPPLPTHN
jgi:GAF domain-containing protein/CheY-like chemotaxis protein